MAELRTFDPNECVITVGGVDIRGYADGTFVSAERTNDAFSMISGADGFVTRVKMNDATGSITLTLQQSSPSNPILSALALADEVSGDSVFPITIKDFSGTTLILAPYCWVRKYPVVGFGKEVGTREWVFDASSIEFFVGDNTRIPA